MAVKNVQQQSTSCVTHTTGELKAQTAQLTAQEAVHLTRKHKVSRQFETVADGIDLRFHKVPKEENIEIFATPMLQSQNPLMQVDA